jgi:hypothetical protein
VSLNASYSTKLLLFCLQLEVSYPIKLQFLLQLSVLLVKTHQDRKMDVSCGYCTLLHRKMDVSCGYCTLLHRKMDVSCGYCTLLHRKMDVSCGCCTLLHRKMDVSCGCCALLHRKMDVNCGCCTLLHPTPSDRVNFSQVKFILPILKICWHLQKHAREHRITPAVQYIITLLEHDLSRRCYQTCYRYHCYFKTHTSNYIRYLFSSLQCATKAVSIYKSHKFGSHLSS